MLSIEDAPVAVVPVPRVFAATRAPSRALVLALLVSAGAAIRLMDLAASGYSEDEVNKLRSVQAYDRGSFSANAEHPMLMKLAIWGAVSAARTWNRHPWLAAHGVIPPEAAIRLPNATVGTATTAVVFLLVEALFDSAVAGWAALFWAVDVHAAAINRIGKEDTFLLFFLLLAAYLYERGKRAPEFVDRRRWFAWSGASFGLMFASKYMPHFFGVHTLYNLAAGRDPLSKTRDKRASFFIVMGAVFLAANSALAMPGTWRYLAEYAHGDMQRHNGYDFAHRIFVNTISASPWGLPPTFYLTFLATKVPLGVLAAAAVGIVWVVRHSTERGATFVRVFLVFTLLPYSFVASKFVRYMLPMLAVIDIVAAIGVVWMIRRAMTPGASTPRLLIGAAIVGCAVASPLATTIGALPYPALAQNAVGAWLAPPGALFPDDELYDAGVREAVAAIASTASPGAVICSDATAVVGEYLVRYGRHDVRSCSIAHDGLPMTAVDTWVIVQDGHIYFENVQIIEQLRRQSPPWREIEVGGVRAAQVFHIAHAIESGGS